MGSQPGHQLREIGAAVCILSWLLAGGVCEARAGQTPRIATPAAGSKVGESFEMTGRTDAYAIVTVEAATDDSGKKPVSKPVFNKKTRADRRGSFGLEVVLPSLHRFVHLYVVSVAPDGSAAYSTLTYPAAKP